MRIIYPIIFRFGDLKKEFINEFEKENLNKYIKHVLESDNFILVNENKTIAKSLLYTTPVFKQIAQVDPIFIANRFLKWAEKEAKILENNRIKNKDTIILIDIRGIDRDQQIYHLSIAINKLLMNEIENEIKVILILESIPNSDDALFKHIFTLIKFGKLKIVDKTIVAFSTTDSSANEVEIAKEKLKGKLIRKIGHFKSQTNQNICKRYFYDGRYCDSEIRILTLDYIKNQIIEANCFEYIFYISSESNWLKTSMSALSGTIEADLKVLYPNYKGAFNIEKISPTIIEQYEGGHILLVADFLNTTKTAREAIATLKEKLTLVTKQKLHVISILNNITRKESNNDTRDFQIGDEIYKVNYFAGVELEEYTKRDCKLCKLNIEHGDIEEDNFLKLRSYDFWDLADKYKFEDEKTKPNLPERKKMYVPIFTKWVEENAPYLAYKFDKFVETNKINTKLNFVIIYPDEPKRILPDGRMFNSASGSFAKKINEIFGATIIGIPRRIIDDISAGKLKLESLNGKKDAWKRDISGIPPRTDIIILDEFHKGGSTLESMTSILEYLGSPAKSYFTIVDFNPSKVKSNKEKEPIMNFYNLYEFNYH